MKITDSRIKEIEAAYAEMKRRGWGFASNGNGFGDPSSTMTVVGPLKDGLVHGLAMDPDPVEAVRKAIANEQIRSS